MGNILPLPCVCHCCRHDEVNELEEGTKKRRKQQQRPDRSSRNNVWAARPRHAVVPVVDAAPEDGDRGGREQEEAWPECRVEPAGRGEDGGAVRVRIVVKRKDIPQLVARLEQRGAEGRNGAAGMEEVVSAELAGCNSGNSNDGDGDGGGTMMSPCRDAWRPRLSIIPEI